MKKIIFNVCGSINKGTGHAEIGVNFYDIAKKYNISISIGCL